MKILPVSDPSFREYGRVLTGYDLSALMDVLEKVSPLPETGTVYCPEMPQMMALPIAKQLENNGFGGNPVELGYCNGVNYKMNCLEYHRCSEINLGTRDFVLLLGKREDVDENLMYDTSKVVGFLVPAGVLVEVYATSLHYAPCCAKKDQPFKCLVTLIKGTNTEKPDITPLNPEDRLLRANNKWLLAHPDADEAKDGAWIGITGENPDISALV